MINTEDTLYPKDKGLSKEALDANMLYYSSLAKRASKEYSDNLRKCSNLYDIRFKYENLFKI